MKKFWRWFGFYWVRFKWKLGFRPSYPTREELLKLFPKEPPILKMMEEQEPPKDPEFKLWEKVEENKKRKKK